MAPTFICLGKEERTKICKSPSSRPEKKGNKTTLRIERRKEIYFKSSVPLIFVDRKIGFCGFIFIWFLSFS